MKKNLTITVISKACGISAPTLRIWEKRYNAFSPDRNETGQRLYSEEDLLRAKMIAALLEKGHSISSVVNLSLLDLRLQINSGREEFSKLLNKNETKKLLSFLEKFDIDALAAELHYQRTSIGAKDFIFKIVLPVMREIGEMVAKGKCSVTQEHIVSSIIRDQLSKIALPSTGQNLEKFALATPEGNLHELAILIADILCKVNRVPTSYLGAAHPAQCLGEAVNALKCQTIVLGVISSDQWNYEKNMTHYLLTLDKSLKNKVKVILGGGWELNFPKFSHITEVKVINDFEIFDEFLSKIL
jgi:DNA-binding transcriptional MerR regulator